jgi:hypothetical protein
VSTSEGERPARPGELLGFDVLAAALERQTGVTASVRPDLPPDAGDPGVALIVPAGQLEELVLHEDAGVRAALARTVVVDAPRDAVLPMLELRGVAAVVEHHQYRAWETGERADASIFGDIRLAPRLGMSVEVTPHDGWRLGRLRIDGEDLPGLIGAYLKTLLDR